MEILVEKYDLVFDGTVPVAVCMCAGAYVVIVLDAVP